MERKDAEDALALIRQVVSRIHDESILQNWGAVMVILAVLDLLAFGLTEVFLWQGWTAVLPYGVLWGIYLVLALIANLAVRKRLGGTSTYVERHIWGNGLTYYLAALAIVVIDFGSLSSPDALVVIPAHLAVISAVSFAFMGLLDARYYLQTVAFFLIALLLVWWPDHGFGVLAIAWFVALLIPGLQLLVTRRRLLASGEYAETL